MNVSPTNLPGSDRLYAEFLTQGAYNNQKSPEKNALYLLEKTGSEHTDFILPNITGVYEGGSLKWQDDRLLPGGSWKRSFFPVYNTYTSVCWSSELSIFCAVGNTGTGNRVITSPDGFNWTTRTSAADYAFTSICWSSQLSLFCATSSNSSTAASLMTSSDGINWTIRTAATAVQWMSVCWSPELSRFVAVSNTGTATTRAMYSSNGINWTSASTPNTTGSYTSVCWSPQLSIFCAVGAQHIITSSDGITWLDRSFSVPVGSGLQSICWSPELSLFCIVGTASFNERVFTSPDGINWTAQTQSHDGNFASVCWSPQYRLFCAAASTLPLAPYIFMTSPDGVSWTSRSAFLFPISSICWSPELSKFCAVGQNGGLVGL